MNGSGRISLVENDLGGCADCGQPATCMFSESAAWYDRFYGTKDYAGEAQLVSALIRRHQPQARTLLDVA